jgi:hypothetical protein
LLNEQLTQLELISSRESTLVGKSIDDLKIKVSGILNKVPRRETPGWDVIQE